MLKQAVGVLASIVALAVIALILAVLVRLSWGPRSDSAAAPSSGPDKLFRKA